MGFIPLIPLRIVEIFLTLDNRLENSVLLLILFLHPLRNWCILACDYVTKQSAELFLSDTIFINFLDKYNTEKKAVGFDQTYWDIVKNYRDETVLNGLNLVLALLGATCVEGLLEEGYKLRQIEFVHRTQVFQNAKRNV